MENSKEANAVAQLENSSQISSEIPKTHDSVPPPATTIKRGPGRPPKQKLILQQLGEESNTNNAASNKITLRSRIPIPVKSISLNHPSVSKNKKSVNQKTSITTSASEKSRSRASRANSASKSVSYAEDDDELALEDDESDSVEELIQSEKAKRPRGRPPKDKSNSNLGYNGNLNGSDDTEEIGNGIKTNENENGEQTDGENSLDTQQNTGKFFPRLRLYVSSKPPDQSNSPPHRKRGRPFKTKESEWAIPTKRHRSDTPTSFSSVNDVTVSRKVLNLRNERINKKVARINEIAENHQEYIKQLYYMETYSTMVNYNSEKVVAQENELLQKSMRDHDLWTNSTKQTTSETAKGRRTTRRILSEQKELILQFGGASSLFTLPSISTPTEPQEDQSKTTDGTTITPSKRGRRPYKIKLTQKPANLFTHNIKPKQIAPIPLSPPPQPVPPVSITKTVIPSKILDPDLATPETLSQYLDGFVWIYDDELTPEEAQNRAKKDAETELKIEELQELGLLTGHTIETLLMPLHPDSQQKKTHWDILLEEMVGETKRKIGEANAKIQKCRRIAKAVAKYWENERNAEEKSGREEEKRIRKIARDVAKELKSKWKMVDTIVIKRYEAILAEEQEKSNKKYLDAIVEHSAQVLNVHRNALAPGNNPSSVENSNADETSALDVLEEEKDMPLELLLEKYGYVVGDSVEGLANENQLSVEYGSSEDEDNGDGRSIDSENEMMDDSDVNEEIDTQTVYPRKSHKVEDDDQSEVDFSDDDDTEERKMQEDAKFEADLDVEEMQENEEDVDEEMRDLADEADLPIEELLKRYQYENGSASINSGSEASSEIGMDEEHPDEDTQLHSEKAGDFAAEMTRSPREVDDTLDEDGENKDIAPDRSPTGNVENISTQEAEESVSERNESPSPNANTPIPFLLKHPLREYQHAGLDWLSNLYANGLNGILADEMGLGKTIQTIALLAHLACVHKNWGPHLIVVPTSVILNWEFEFKKWCPGFKILTYYGSQKERKDKRVGWSKQNSFHICITSYQLVLHDQAMFKRKQWQYMVLDEAHNIKNFRSQRWQTLLTFNTERRLLLTGTPLQNNLMELWSLLYFLMPNGITSFMPAGFATHKDFQEWFSNPVDKVVESGGMDEESRQTIQKLHTILRPYLLRRLKVDVEKQMPKKYEHILKCRLSKRQRFLYDDFMSRAKTKEDLASGNYFSIINCLMQLRKVCNHPDLFEVRPIITSFIMTNVVFEEMDATVRAVMKLLYDPKDIWRIVDFYFLNLRFTRWWFNDSVSLAQSASAIGLADCTPQFNVIQMQLISELEDFQARGVSSELNYKNIREYGESMKLREVAVSMSKNAHKRYVNQLRCRRILFPPPLLGDGGWKTRGSDAGIVRECLKLGARDIDSIVGSKQFLNLSPATQDLFNRLERWEDPDLYAVVDRYSVVSNKVKVLPRIEPVLSNEKVGGVFEQLSENMFSKIDKNYPSEVIENTERAEQLVQLAMQKSTIAFPDKMLLQFDCGKLQTLDALLKQLKPDGHRVLIFTQMARVLDILEIFLNLHGHRYLRLDGGTKIEHRQILMDRFNSDKRIFVFILSTRSGGIGMNLTGADTVVFYDSDWNPAMDAQAQDRAHRIGQTRDVHIYRLISEHTIEENMLRKANQKRQLDNLVIQEGDFTTDYIKRLNWQDWLGNEDRQAEKSSEEDRDGTGSSSVLSIDNVFEGGVPGSNNALNEALAAAEDEQDVSAMRIAQKELDLETMEFSEIQKNAESESVEAAGELRNQRRRNTSPTAELGDEDGGNRDVATRNNEEYSSNVTMGHIDNYMFRFCIWQNDLEDVLNIEEFVGEADEGQ